MQTKAGAFVRGQRVFIGDEWQTVIGVRRALGQLFIETQDDSGTITRHNLVPTEDFKTKRNNS